MLRSVRDLLAVLSDKALDKIISTATRAAGTTFETERVVVEVRADGDIDCTYHLRRLLAGESKQLIVECRSTAWRAVTTEVDGHVTTHESARNRNFISVDVPEKADALELSVSIGWPSSRTGQPRYVLAVPEDLPKPVCVKAEEREWPLAALVSVHTPPGSRLIASGVFLTEQDRGRSTFVDVLVASGTREFIAPECALVLSDGFAVDLSSNQRARVASLYGRIYDVTAQFYGRTPVSQRLVTVPGEYPPTHSSFPSRVFKAEPKDFGVGTIDDPEDFLLALHVAGAWWGGVARIHGVAARELELTLRIAAALNWIEFSLGTAAREALLENLKAVHSRRGRAHRLAYLAETQCDPTRLMAYIVLLEQRARRDASWPGSLREFTAICWGKSVPAPDALAWLRSAT